MVCKATLTVTANNASMTYGGTLPAFSASYSGFQNGDDQGVLTGSPNLTTTATSTSPVGSYPITAAQGTLAAQNYTFVFVNGSLMVCKATLTVTANNASMTYGGTLPRFTAGYSGFQNGDGQGVLSGCAQPYDYGDIKLACWELRHHGCARHPDGAELYVRLRERVAHGLQGHAHGNRQQHQHDLRWKSPGPYRQL